MRIAALAFGVLAGLVASLILALGGLSALYGTPDRQASLILFGLFIIGNLGIFGAGLVLAVPLAGAIIFVLGAIAWLAAAFLLHHGPDTIMLTPPGLLLVAFVLGMVAWIRSGRAVRAPAAAAVPNVEEDEDAAREAALNAPIPVTAPAQAPQQLELTTTSVGAGFFGQGGTAMPLNPEPPPPAPPRPASRTSQLLGINDDGSMRSTPATDEKWRPGTRSPPPRQQSVFREDEDEDEESGFSRLARGFSSVLSFGLYAALAAAAVLIIWNFRNGATGTPTAVKLAPSSVAVAANVGSFSKAPPVLSRLPMPSTPSTPPAPAVALGPPAVPSTAPAELPAVSHEQMDLLTGVQSNNNLGGLVVAPDIEQSFPASVPPATASGPPASANTLTSAPASADLASASSSSEPLAAAADAANGAVMPLTMPTEMAAARAQPTHRRPTPPPPPPAGDTGL